MKKRLTKKTQNGAKQIKLIVHKLSAVWDRVAGFFCGMLREGCRKVAGRQGVIGYPFLVVGFQLWDSGCGFLVICWSFCWKVIKTAETVPFFSFWPLQLFPFLMT
jgi:hypothetical protein